MTYKLVDDHKKTGYKGKRLSNDNLSSYPENLLKLWEKANIIEKIETKTKKEK